MLSVSQLADPGGHGSSLASGFVWKYCRMCARKLTQGVFIFGEEGKRLQLPEKIRKTVAILVLEEDSLPKKICTSCCTSLETYGQFKDGVVDAQEKLSAIARSIEKSHEQSLLQIRSRQLSRSPKHSKMHQSSLASHSGSHGLISSHSFPWEENDIEDSPVECDEPLNSVMSSEDEENTSGNKAVPECSSAVEANPKDDEIQVPSQGSPPVPSSKQVATASSASPEANSSGSFPEKYETVAGRPENKIVNSEGEEKGDETDARLICGVCSANVKDRDSLFAHHVKQHDVKMQKDPTYGCSACPRISPNYEAIRQHIYRHRMADAFKCADCEKSYSTKDQLDVHISSKHNPAGTKAFLCNTCGKQYGTNVALLAHQRKKHSPRNAVGINLKQDTSEGTRTNVTSASNYPEVPPPSSSSIVEQSECQSNNVNTSSSDPLAIVEKPGQDVENLNTGNSERQQIAKSSSDASKNEKSSIAEREGYWKCGICEKILYSKHGYDTHIGVHKGRRFTCEHCGVSYTQKPTLEHHIKVHHTNLNKEFECPECKKRFKTIRQLSWHKKTHEKPLTDLQCPQCEKKFLNMISLRTHMKLHKGYKRFSCTDCPKSFYTKMKLEEHMNSHSGLRPFGCPVENCTKVFSCVSNYSKHFKKHHFELLGPRGSMVPKPKRVGNSQNSGTKSNEPNNRDKARVGSSSLSEKAIGNAHKTSGYLQPPTTQGLSSSSESQNHTVAHLPVHVISNPQISTSGLVTKPSTGVYTIVNPPSSGHPAPASQNTTPSQAHGGCLSLVSSSNASHSHPVTLHSSAPSTTADTQTHQTAAHQSFLSNVPQPHAHHHHPINVHSSPAAHTNNGQSGMHSQPVNQPQPQNHSQSVWQPVILPVSKSYHHPNATGLTTINGLDLLDCGGTITGHQSDAHNQHGNTNSVNVIHVPVSAAHLSTSSHSSHFHHGISAPSSSGHHPVHGSSHGSSSQGMPPISHSNSASSSHSHHLPPSSTAGAMNIPNFVPSSQQSEPMELSYKLESNNFQDMPMELTKVFQRDPLELCVRQDFSQPLMDLSSRVVNVSVGGNPSINVNSLSVNMSSGNNNNSQSHYSSINSGSTVINVPYHKTVELVERELLLNDYTGAYRQPIDLISRSDEQSHELCSEGNLVDLSLRSSFVQDHSASSFLRELIDLSSRSDTFHGEINLTNKPNPPSSNSHSSHLHHHSHSASTSHTVPKAPNAVHNSSAHHHNHHNHHHHHHSQTSNNQSSSGNGTVTLQNVIYQDAMFSLQN